MRSEPDADSNVTGYWLKEALAGAPQRSTGCWGVWPPPGWSRLSAGTNGSDHSPAIDARDMGEEVIQ
jgi:hypothetical protein